MALMIFWVVSMEDLLLDSLVLAHESATINWAMKRVPPKAKKKSQAKESTAIRALRGKYKHLDLMKALIETRRKERVAFDG